MVTASVRCCGAPAPPEAITGMVTGVGDETGEGQFIAVQGAVGVDGIDAQFARAQFLATPRPGQGVQPGGLAAAVDDDFIARRLGGGGGHPAHVHTHHHGLRTEGRRAVGDEFRTFDRRRVERHLFRPASSTARMSSTLAMPPPTENGMKMAEATRSTTSRKIPRASCEAVMS